MCYKKVCVVRFFVVIVIPKCSSRTSTYQTEKRISKTLNNQLCLANKIGLGFWRLLPLVDKKGLDSEANVWCNVLLVTGIPFTVVFLDWLPVCIFAFDTILVTFPSSLVPTFPVLLAFRILLVQLTPALTGTRVVDWLVASCV